MTCGKLCRGSGRQTVYHTLKLPRDAGLVVVLRIGDESARFDAVNPHSTHDHLIFRNFGKVVEIHNPALQKTQAKLAQEHGFILENRAHCVYGLCLDGHIQKQTEKVS
ncbi:MAG: transcriptional repressor [Candidatus Accumulibacter sp.]|nr:transcriptional repressor [Accumulibacter sp.]